MKEKKMYVLGQDAMMADFLFGISAFAMFIAIVIVLLLEILYRIGQL